MGKRAKVFIVRAAEFNGLSGILFAMSETDSRFGSTNYSVVTGGRFLPGKVVSPNGRPVRTFQGEDGASYMVFSDWSAKAT